VLADLKPVQTLDARQRMQRITMRVILSAVFGLHEGERCRPARLAAAVCAAAAHGR